MAVMLKQRKINVSAYHLVENQDLLAHINRIGIEF